MTIAFASFTLGAMLFYSAIKDATISDVVLGREPSHPTSPLPSFLPGGKGTSGLPSLPGLGSNSHRAGQSTYKGIVICNWIIDIIKAAEKDVGPLQPTSGVRPGYDPHTSSGKSCHSGCAKGSGPGTGAVDFGGYDGSPDAEKFRHWLANHGNPMKGGDSYGDFGHFSRDGS